MASPPGFVPSSRAFGEDSLLDASILSQVNKPSRYLGGEVGQVRKDLDSVETLVGLCYPDLYEIGMSHIGLKILYSILNADPSIAAERVYAVAPDFERQIRARSETLKTLENRIPLHALDVLGFTLQYELSYTNVLQVLDLGGIPLRAADRRRDDPIVIAGGPCAFNPEPLATFLDAVCLGDGEETITAVVAAVAAWKRSGKHRQDLLWALTEIPGVYVPSLYTPHYNADGTVAAIVPAPGLPPRIRKAILTDLDAAPYQTTTPVPFMEVVHDRVGVEIQRGCMRGCRFCQAGYVYRPERQRSPERVRELVRKGLKATGWEEYSLLSLSAGDYTCMEPLLTSLMDEHEGGRSAISLPSMRLETLTPGIMREVGRVRKTSFTVAPEAASDRLRGVINKVIDEDVLIDMVGEVFQRGWTGLKLYFMLGLPTEQQDDLEAMIDLGSRCLGAARRHRRSANITVSVSSFVPKSHTPFQWARQITLDQIRDKQMFLKDGLRRAKLGFRYHHDRSTVMEGIFSRGDRRSGEALLRAYELGCRLDGWQEHLDEDAWSQAFAETNFDPTLINQRRRDVTEVFPWQHIDVGMKPEWLWADWMDALEAGFVPDCTTEPCYDCGVCDHQVVHNRVYGADAVDVAPVHRVRKPWMTSRKKMDPQFVAMPKPPAKKANNVVDAVPPQGMAPGSAGARFARARSEDWQEDARHANQPRTTTGHPDSWDDCFDTRLPVEMRLKAQVRYGKRGALVHLGHLEVMNTFKRALRRMEAPILWSQGFHPMPKMQFTSPLPTSMGSVCEFAEFELKRPVDLQEFERLLRDAMPEDLPILAVNEVPWKSESVQQRVASWTYRVCAPEPAADAARAAVARFLRGEDTVITVLKKKKERQVDLADVVLALRADEREPGEPEGAAPFTVEVPSVGAGARIRDVLRGIFGDAAATLEGGWTVIRVGAEMKITPLPATSEVPARA